MCVALLCQNENRKRAEPRDWTKSRKNGGVAAAAEASDGEKKKKKKTFISTGMRWGGQIVVVSTSTGTSRFRPPLFDGSYRRTDAFPETGLLAKRSIIYRPVDIQLVDKIALCSGDNFVCV